MHELKPTLNVSVGSGRIALLAKLFFCSLTDSFRLKRLCSLLQIITVICTGRKRTSTYFASSVLFLTCCLENVVPSRNHCSIFLQWGTFSIKSLHLCFNSSQKTQMICSTLYTAIIAMCACSLKYSLVSAILCHTCMFFLSQTITHKTS